MKITVMQVNNELQHRRLRLCGRAAPGQYRPRRQRLCVSGGPFLPRSSGVRRVYSRELILWQDSALQVSWGLNPPEMIVSHTKK